MDGVNGSNGAIADVVERVALVELRDGFNRLRGRLFQAIEAAGLPEVQTVALKGLIRRTSYDMQANLEQALRGGD